MDVARYDPAIREPAVPRGTFHVQIQIPTTGVPVLSIAPRSGSRTTRTGAYRTGRCFPGGVSDARPHEKRKLSGRIVISATWKSVTTAPV